MKKFKKILFEEFGQKNYPTKETPWCERYHCQKRRYLYPPSKYDFR